MHIYIYILYISEKRTLYIHTSIDIIIYLHLLSHICEKRVSIYVYFFHARLRK